MSLLAGNPILDLPEPYQIRVRPGDVVLAHHGMPHTVAPNHSPDIRYALYFRVHSKQRAIPWQPRPEAMSDIWMEFEGMRDIVAEFEGKAKPKAAAAAAPAAASSSSPSKS